MSNAEQIKSRLEELTSFIEEAQSELADGKVVNLSHLDNEVEELCQQTLSLAPQEAQQVQPVMATMISRLEELSVALQDFQKNLKNNEGA